MDVHSAGAPPPHVDDGVEEQEGEEVLRIERRGVLLHASPGLRHLALPAAEGDGPVRPLDEPPAHRRVAVGGLEDRLLEVQDPDPELLAEGPDEGIVLQAGLVAAERPLVERGIWVQQPEEHLDPRPVDDNLPERLPLRPHARRHPAHRLRRGWMKKTPIITPAAAAAARIQFTRPPSMKLIPA